MERGLKAKFVIYFLFFVLGICAIFLFFDWFRINTLAESNLRTLGEEMVKNLSYSSGLAVTSRDPDVLEPVFEGILKNQDVVLLAVYDNQRNLILSQKELAIEEKISEKIFKELNISDDIVTIEREIKEGVRIYDFYYPIKSSQVSSAKGKQIIGYARIALSLKRAANISRQILLQSVLIVIFLIIVSFFVAILLAEKMVRPIKTFIRGVKKVGQGNLSYRFYVKTGDEIEDLAEAFNQMVEQLERSTKELEESKSVLEIRVQARTQELKEFADDLNRQVQERTKELKERVDELERFHKIVVGRETKMIELKNKIKKLKEKLKNKK